MADQSSDAPPTQEVRGTIERITYANPQNGYTIARLAPEHPGGLSAASQDTTGLIWIVGNLERAEVGDAIVARGWWQNDPTHGWRFQSQSCDITRVRAVRSSQPRSATADDTHHEASMDVRRGIYEDAIMVIDYYATGTIGTAPALAELCAVVNFHLRFGLPPFPMGILPIDKPGGFLRGKQRVFHCVGGMGSLPVEPIASYGEARMRMQALALAAGGDILRRNPQFMPLISAPQTFAPGHRSFQVRFYGEPFELAGGGEIASGEVHSVIHLEDDKYPWVAILVGDNSEAPNPHYRTAILSADGDAEYLRQFATVQEAQTHATRGVALIGAALYIKSTAGGLHQVFDKWGIPVPQSVAGAPAITPQQAQAQYDQIINSMR